MGKRNNRISINPKYGLEAAILAVATEDYKEALRRQREGADSLKVDKAVRKLEKFFLSEWGQLLSGDLGELIIEKCRQEVWRDEVHRIGIR